MNESAFVVRDNYDVKRAIIYEVKERPFLYDSQHPNHNKRTLTHETWEEIGATVGIHSEEAKKTWYQIRAYTNTHLSQLKRNPPRAGTSERKNHTPWAYADDMDFLLPHLGMKRKRVSDDGMVTAPASGITPVTCFNDISDEDTTATYSAPPTQPAEPPSPYVENRTDSSFNTAVISYLAQQATMSASPGMDHVQGWFLSVQPQLKTFGPRAWMNFMTDCNRLILKYMSCPPAPHLPT